MTKIINNAEIGTNNFNETKWLESMKEKELIWEKNRQKLAEIVYQNIRENKTLSNFDDRRFLGEMGIIQTLKNNQLCCLISHSKKRDFKKGKISVLQIFLTKWNEESKKLDLGYVSHCNHCRKKGVELFWLKKEY